ncbi:MAG: citrate synthase/methylcitrate synthase [Pyrobaculum arsenaticum]|uniref:Citrate synthase n=2 Tax=Pyrobaculum arsenaticum TaxID=121277 RepID=A4WJP6_PYRAR|nr:citrate synthase/methylcitrate synthase [Pyrobaculum arsenaticum]ABP50613.1 citrate synthase [Pyrobaculum arsenaticum DSM 13514]MCY0889538.1 citrate synthase/methylcitrate synthase [Pyrobaculum arsenaticum]NYR14456.1 citrate synthase/methylcitrate synthase [Pyrobaculum arsenaticum]
MYLPGLEGVVVKETKICYIDLENSKIYYRGYDLEELARLSTFEEVTYLLWFGRLPGRRELEEFKARLAAHRLPLPHVAALAKSAPPSAEPIDVLRTAVSAMAWGEDLSDKSPEAELQRGLKITAAMPYVVAAFDRARRGQEPVHPAEAGSHAEYFLWALRGERPSPREARAMDVMLIVYAEHSMNNSAFTAVTVASTFADMYAAVTAAVASLKGPLHGGANVDAAKMIEEIGDAKKVERWVDEQLAKGRRIPGFGHRLYKKGPDPRLRVLRELAKGLAAERGDFRWVEIAERLEDYVTAKLAAKGIYPNTDLYAAVIFRYLGLPVDINLPTFAISRAAGWVAHVLEYRQANRLIRPTEKYVGPIGLKYIPLEERS